MTGRDNNNDSFDAFKQLNDISRQNLKYLTGALPPFAAALAKWNLEMLRFSAQRALEYRDLSTRLSQCSSPADLWKEQARFFEHMQAEYSEEMGRLLDLLNGISNVSPDDGLQAANQARSAQPQPGPAAAAPGARETTQASEEAVNETAQTVDETAQASGEAVSQTAETARQMAGVASEAAGQVTEEARAAMQQVDKDAPGAPQAQAAIQAAEAAANTIARQAEATAALMTGSAAAMGGAIAGDAWTDAESAESDDSSDEDDADTAGSLIAEPTPAAVPADDSDEETGASEIEDDTQSAEAMISEPEPEPDDETEDDSGGDRDDDDPTRSSAGGGVSDSGDERT